MYNCVQFCIKSKHQAKTHMRSRLLGHACCFEGWLPAVLKTTKSANSEICPPAALLQTELTTLEKKIFLHATIMAVSWFLWVNHYWCFLYAHTIKKFLHWLKSVVSNSKYHIGSKGRVDVISYIIFIRCTYYLLFWFLKEIYPNGNHCYVHSHYKMIKTS